MSALLSMLIDSDMLKRVLTLYYSDKEWHAKK